MMMGIGMPMIQSNIDLMNVSSGLCVSVGVADDCIALPSAKCGGQAGAEGAYQ
jgi:hypothetical protein